MCNSCSLRVYRLEQRRYFNWAAGVRATDKYHRVAQRYFERMKTLETTQSGKRRLAEEALEISAQIRESIATLLGCDDRNIILGNSASLMAALVLRAIIEKHGIDQIQLAIHSDFQYPAVVLPFVRPIEETERILTQPNYACVPSGHEFLASGRLLRHLIAERCIGEEHIIRVKSIPGPPYLLDFKPYLVGILDTVNRLYGTPLLPEAITSFNESLPLRHGRRGRIKKAYILADASHSFALLDSDSKKLEIGGLSYCQPLLYCDGYIAGSSKALGAEPTIGFAIVRDGIMDLIGCLIPRICPNVAFQFSPKSGFGTRDVDEAEKAMYWISLPELASMKAALAGLRKQNPEHRVEALSKIRKRLIEGIETLNKREENIIHQIGDIGEPMFDDFGSLWRTNRYFEAVFGVEEDNSCIPNYLVIELLAHDGNEVQAALRKRGFVVQCLSSTPFIEADENNRQAQEMKDGLRRYIRVSFRHDVDQDIDGLLNALENVLKILPRRKIRGLDDPDAIPF